MTLNMDQLKERLVEEGCNPNNYAVGRFGPADDAYRIVYDGGTWIVFYTERGSNSPPIFKSSNEDEACQFFLEKILSLRNDHCVARFLSQAEADTLKAELDAHKIASYQDVIPYSTNVKMYRIFVQRKAIIPTRDLLGTVPRLGPGVSF
jgi:hypothetical protein